MTNNETFSREEAESYWKERHRRHRFHWPAVGFQGGSAAVNKAFYDCRRRALSRALRGGQLDVAGKRVLDAGCGLGFFSEFYHSRGAQVYGVDLSADAVQYCSSKDIGTFTSGRLSDIPELFSDRFDLVHCFDVLYHITDDAEWEKTIAALAAVSHDETAFVFTEIKVETTTSTSDHIQKRAWTRYRDVLAAHHFRIAAEIPIYWLYVRSPGLGTRMPWIIPYIDRLASVLPANRPEEVVVWLARRST